MGIAKDEARLIAVNWQNQVSDSHFSVSDIDTVHVRYQNGFPAIFIVVFQPKGWVMVSGHKAALPVIAYSSVSVFDVSHIPQQLDNWIDGVADEIKQVADDDLKPSTKMEQKWEQIKIAKPKLAPLAATTGSAGPLLSSQWDQGRYYNEMAPVDPLATTGNGHVWIGCVATAMAQTMNYWKYPASGTGTHTYNHPDYGDLSADFGTSFYNWSALPNKATALNEEMQEVNYHAAVAVNMNFGPYSSGAYLNDACNALTQYFNYNTTIFEAIKNEWDNENDWVNMLKSEIDNGRPVIYAGYNTTGRSGHAFVCDGYTNDYFHFNWGWSGYADGNFLLSALTPGSSNYSYNQSAIFGLEPVIIKQISSPYTEGFENGNEGHFSLFGKANIVSDQKHSGTFSLRLSQQGFSSYSKNSASLAFLVPSDGNLSFWVKRVTDAESTFNKQQALLLPQHGDVPIHTFFNASFTDDDWVNYTLDLAAYAGQTVRLMFVQQNFDHFKEQWMYIDNVSITGVHQNLPPFEPSNPQPANNELSVEHEPVLRWSGGDINGDRVTYSVYFGADSNPPFVSQVSDNTYTPDLLNHSTKYYWWVESTDGELTSSGPVWSFTTRGIPPEMGLCGVSDLASDAATVCGEIITTHGAVVYSKGVCWNKKGQPTIGDYYTTTDTLSDAFSCRINQLEPFTKYYVRSFVESNEGVAYSQQQSFVTLPGLPVITYIGLVNATRTSATLTGEIADLNDSLIVARGLVWSTVQGFDPNQASTFVETGNWNNPEFFDIEITNLPGPNIIYVRFFAENSAGKAFSTEHSFVLPNTAPEIDLDADDSTLAPETGFKGHVFEQQAGGRVADTDVLISDIDGDTIVSVRFELVNPVHEGYEYLKFVGDDSHLLVNGNESTLIELQANSTVSNTQWEHIVEQVELFVDVDAPNTKDLRKVRISVNDGFDNSTQAEARLQVVAVNDAPICKVLPYIDGEVVFGSQVVAQKGQWADELDNCSLKYTSSFKWQALNNDQIVDIENQNDTILHIDSNLCGMQIRVVEMVEDLNCGGDNPVVAQAESNWYSVGQIAQQVVFDPIPTQTFDRLSCVLSATASSGLPLTFGTNSSSIINIVADTAYFHSVGRAVITCMQAGDACYFPTDVQFKILTIEKGVQNIIADIDRVYYSNSEPVALAISASSGLQPSIESSNPLVAEFVDGFLNVYGVGNATLNITQSGNDNYLPANEVGIDIEVKKALQKVNFDVSNQLVFGNGNVHFNLNVDSGLLSDLTSLSTNILEVTNDSLIIKGAGTAFINITNSGNDHWQQLDTLIVLQIEKGIQLQNAPDSLVIAFSNNAFIMPLEVNSNLEIEYELNGDVLALANGQFSTLKTGTERVRVFSNGDDNWHEFEHFVEVIVEKGKQYIEFESLPQYSFNQLGVQLNALSSSGLPIFFVLSDTTVVQMISADSLVFHTSGMVTITATQPGNDNWFEAPSVARQLIIDKAEQSITTALNDTLLVGQAFSWADFQASSGLNISNIKSSNNELISVSADSFNVLSIGNVVLTVTQQGDMRYHPVAVDFNFVGTNKTANNESKNIWFALYPNPASSFVVFEYNGQINGNEYVEIYDTSGRLLLLRHLSSNTIRFDLSGLLPGLYFVKFRGGLNFYHEKLIIK